MASLERMVLPSFGSLDDRPETESEEYEHRIDRIVRNMQDRDIEVLVVYGDREHAGDMAYLCGVDPRFEEGLLILATSGLRQIVLGNECQAYGPPPELRIEQVLYQEFSPQGQVRDRPVQLSALLTGAGLSAGTRAGVAGGKYLSPGFSETPEHGHSVPSYIVDALRTICGHENVVNAEWLFLDPSAGVRMTASATEIAQFDHAARLTSAGVLRAMRRLEPGVAEFEVANAFEDNGLPRSAHAMVNFGEKAKRGLSSASGRRARLGDTFQMAFALQGALTCRAGAVARNEKDLPEPVAGIFPKLVDNYFDVLATWYESLDLGRTTGEVFAAADGVRDPDAFEFLLNPGHFLHIEEWSNSTFRPDDGTVLRSGMVLQGDIIPVSAGPWCFVNIEDGVALADESLRRELSAQHPGLWDRVLARRQFVENVIGVKLSESVLPLGDIPLWHTPYVLDAGLALTR